MAIITMVVTYTEAADDGKKPVVSGINVDGNALAAARTELEKRKAWFAADEIRKSILRQGLLGTGSSPDKIIDP